MLFFFPRIRLIFTRLFIRYIFSNRHVAMLWLASFWIFERQFIELVLNSRIKRIVATHTDREHIHNHIIYNSTALDSTRKFRDFLLSGLAVQRLSDLICLEHQLSVIEIKPYRERQKRTLYPPRESNRDKLCAVIDNILLNEKPESFVDFLQKLEQQSYEIKRGKCTSVKGTRQKRFIASDFWRCITQRSRCTRQRKQHLMNPI